MSGFELFFPFMAGSTAAGVGTGVGVGAGAAGVGLTGGAMGVGLGGTAAAGGTSIMSSLPMLLMSGSSLLQGVGQYQSNKANAEISKVQSKQARLNAAYNERRQREVSARVMGDQAARFGASGVAMEGTPLLVMADQARQSELEALAIRNQGKTASEGYKAEASQYSKAASYSLMGGLLESATYGGAAYAKAKGYY